jgi:GAF domain-containing protein
VYLLDPESGDLRLWAHAGVSSGFAAHVSQIAATARQARIAKAGVSVFASHRELLAEPGTRREVEEGLRAFAALPVRHEGTVIAVVNLASRTQDDFTPQQSSLMETLAAQIGGVVARLRGEAELREELARLRAQHGRDAG